MSSLCRSLKITYPILQSGMGRVAGPDLVGAVARAGGLGILAGLNLTPDDLRGQIRRVRELTTGTFGVNLWLHPDLHPPIDPSSVPVADVEAATAALNRARLAIGLRESVAPPLQRPDTIDDAFNVILDERVPVWSIGLGLPAADMLSRCHDRGVQVMVMVANVDDARTAADLGVDFIVAQGVEAGGHRSTWRAKAAADVGTLALVPEVVDAVRVPVIAAGGIADGRGLVAALALGAAGVLMGTRFVATRESMAPEFWKQRILAAASDQTIVTTAFTGLRARVLRSQFAQDYAASGAPVLPGLLQAALEQDIWAAASKENRPDYFPLYAGQSVGVIRDLPGAGDVVGAIVAEAKSTLTQLADIL
ncbi:MAG: nitronate monooxygenase [Acidobacteria bacterium]|nr:MAG: nitronate monooxygenase [Acidobacteriota bacterium]